MAILRAGLYKSTKNNRVVVAEDGTRNLYAIWDGKVFGARSKWPPKYKNYEEFVKGQGLIRVGDWDGVFF